MVGKNNHAQKKEKKSGKKAITGNKFNEYPAFRTGDLPDHHYTTVKDWLSKYANDLKIFSNSLIKKIDYGKSAKVFHTDCFSVNELNDSLTSFYNILDSSVNGLLEFRAALTDYISSWKVALNDALESSESSDSSVEILEQLIPQSLIVPEAKPEKDPLSITNTEEKKISSVPQRTFRRIRVRKPSEVNNLATLEDGELVSDSRDVCNGSSKESEQIAGPSSKIIEGCDEESYPNDAHNKSLKTNGISIEEEAATSPEVAEATKEDDVSEDCDIINSPVAAKSQSTAEQETTQKKKNCINWDSSSDSDLDDDVWPIKWGGKSDTKKIPVKKEVLNKKLEKKKINDSIFTSSDDECEQLCKLGSLEKKKRTRVESSSGSETSSKGRSTKGRKPKRSKIEETKKSLLDFADDSQSESSGSYASDELFTLNTEKYKRSLQEVVSFKPEDFLCSKVEEDSISVISDSSLDSIVSELQKTCTVKRGSSRKGKSSKMLAETKKGGSRRKRDRLLDEKLTDTDTSEAEEQWNKLKMKKRIKSSESEGEAEGEDVCEEEPKTSKTNKSKKPRKKMFSDSDEDFNASDESANDDNEDSGDEKSDSAPKPAGRKRKRIQKTSDTSDSDGEPSPSKSGDGKGRKNIRKLLKEESLEKSTKEALKEEEERKKRILEKQAVYNSLINKKNFEAVEVLEELVLDFDEETKKPIVSVDKDLVKRLKPHQAQGIKFMWDSCFESVKEAKKNKGSGCILAHCMGLGKTLQVISLVHTLLTCKEVEVDRVLVVCPFSTVQNWVNEFHKWLKDVGSGEDLEIYHMIKTAPNHRSYQLRDWERTGGVMVLGYNLFRSLAAPKGRQKASVKKAIQETLLDPGPDVVICDEGHILKNEKTAVNVAMNKLATRRRIVLTGTPLQNNLVEYHCMVQFVKPNLLGTRKEFQNRFVHPITNGQFEDSTTNDVKLMKRRAHVLHKMLDGIVQRKDYNVLTPYLPPKYEYVIHVKLTEIQIKLYRHYLENFARTQKNEGGGLFTDFQHLMRICTHPRSLLIHSDKESLKIDKEEEDSEGSIKDFIDDDSDESSASSHESSSSKSNASSDESDKKPVRKRVTRAQKASGEVVSEEEEELPVKRTEWWSEMVTEEELEAINTSNKLYLFFTILKHCEEIGDKLLVFSQSLYTLDLIEYFLEQVDDNNRRSEDDKKPGLSEFSSSWDKGLDYFRLDGGTNSDCRNNFCKTFNSPNNTRARLFLISTKAGGLGINLTGANRVIIFDASWNPSFDVQSIFRVYRFGQTKPCYIYRFLSKGTMEEKIYERQVAKLSTSLRVIDEQQIDRHFSQTSLAELYAFNPDAPENRDTPALPKDRLMAELLQAHPDIILSHHQHDSLLENQEDEELNEEERKAAWVEFENEKNHVPPPITSFNMMNPNMGMNPNMNFYNQYRTTGKMDQMQFAMEYNNLLNILVQKVRISNPLMSEEAVRKRAIEILAQQNFMQSLMQQKQQQMANFPFQNMMAANYYNQQVQPQIASANLPLRNYAAAPPMMNNLNFANNVNTNSAVKANLNSTNQNNEAGKDQVKNKEKETPQLIEIQDDE